MKLSEATYSTLPWFTGDGYSYGGAAVVTIGNRSIMVGEGPDSHELATEIVDRWNAGRAALAQEERHAKAD